MLFLVLVCGETFADAELVEDAAADSFGVDDRLVLLRGRDSRLQVL